MINKKALIKMLNDHSFDGYYDMLDNYLEHFNDNVRELKPKPSEKINYVGIEIECFTRLGQADILAKLLEHDLEKCVEFAEDNSIDEDFGDNLELRVLLPEKKLKVGLSKLSKILKSKDFGVNDSCGLHIHLDMRHRNVDECYSRLLKFQDVLFGLVDKKRWDNEFCEYTTQENVNLRYVAINKSAYDRHQTIEIRLHHATLDMKKIEKWVNLLLTIIGSKNPPPIATKVDVLKWAKKKPGLRAYVAKNFKQEWFEEKHRFVSGDR